MTQTDFAPAMSFVTLADAGHTLLFNDNETYSAGLPLYLSRRKTAEKICLCIDKGELTAVDPAGLVTSLVYRDVSDFERQQKRLQQAGLKSRESDAWRVYRDEAEH